MTILLFPPKLRRVLKWDLLFNERRGSCYYWWVSFNRDEWLVHSLTTWPSPTHTYTRLCHRYTDSDEVKVTLRLRVSQSWGSWPDISSCFEVTALSMWGALSDERSDWLESFYALHFYSLLPATKEAGLCKDGRSRQGRLFYITHLDQQYRKHSYPLKTEDRLFLVCSTFSLLQKKGSKQSAVYSSAKCMPPANSPATEPRLQAERAINVPSESAYGLLRNAVLVSVS
jgi:hypothetical protein